jgi:hypothetical protein
MDQYRHLAVNYADEPTDSRTHTNQLEELFTIERHGQCVNIETRTMIDITKENRTFDPNDELQVRILAKDIHQKDDSKWHRTDDIT